MTTLRAAAQQALEALDDALQMLLPKQQSDKARRAAYALRAALAEPEQEPVFTPAMIDAIYAAWHGAGVDIAGGNWARFVGMLNVGDPPQRPAEPVQEPAFHGFMSADGTQVDVCVTPSAPRSDGTYAAAYYAAPPNHLPLTVERLRDALVASRIVPPAAVEDPDGYDDGVTLHRIEALHRRLT